MRWHLTSTHAEADLWHIDNTYHILSHAVQYSTLLCHFLLYNTLSYLFSCLPELNDMNDYPRWGSLPVHLMGNFSSLGTGPRCREFSWSSSRCLEGFPRPWKRQGFWMRSPPVRLPKLPCEVADACVRCLFLFFSGI